MASELKDKLGEKIQRGYYVIDSPPLGLLLIHINPIREYVLEYKAEKGKYLRLNPKESEQFSRRCTRIVYEEKLEELVLELTSIEILSPPKS